MRYNPKQKKRKKEKEKGATGLRSPQRKHDAEKKDRCNQANLSAGDGRQGRSAKRATLKNLMRECRTPVFARCTRATGCPASTRVYYYFASI
jgi:hypothetical protein